MGSSAIKTAGIILAAGASSRMGKPKQLLPFGKTTLLGQVIHNARQSDLHEIIVVLGHGADKIQQSLDLSGTRTILNPAYQSGQSTSLKAGLDAVSDPCQGIMFLLGDQPLVTADIINHLTSLFADSPDKIIIPCLDGQRGNPVILPLSLFPHIPSLSGDRGARALFDRFKHLILRVPVLDPAILTDVDTPADYQRLISAGLDIKSGFKA